MAAERPQHPPHRDVIVIGGSAGSLDTIREIAQAIPADYSGTVFVVAHVGQSRSILPDLLSTLMDLMHPASRRRDGRASNCE